VAPAGAPTTTKATDDHNNNGEPLTWRYLCRCRLPLPDAATEAVGEAGPRQATRLSADTPRTL
jgi:hypothetical protein